MSAEAEFRLIEKSWLDELLDHAKIKTEKKLFRKKGPDRYKSFLNSHSKKLKDGTQTGSDLTHALEFLAKKKGVNLLSGKYDSIAHTIGEERQASTFILTYEHRQNYVDKLNVANFTKEELVAFNKTFSEDDDPELANAEIECIRTLKDNLEALPDDNHVIVVSIG
ncbi:hypothetical protein WSM22_47470 [Cytophagales bacterium WSM2-2]|nr:hypothetical protein WSM22_47470 [Cytophagales bacterium WSM2-2]